MITNTLLLVTIILGIILLVPMVCRWIHVPNIVGFILAGMLVGPSCLGWIDNNDTMRLLGQLGMLYIMFQSGSEIDINDFKRYRFHAIWMGLLSFCLPFAFGLLAGKYALQYNWTTSVLIGAMLGSHTLMTYPIVSRYGLQKNRAVNITISATMWAVTISLVVLAGVEASGVPHSSLEIWRTVGAIALLLLVVLVLFPIISQWFFKRYQDPTVGFLLVMTMLLLAAWLADIAGLEGILGAFLCGVALNRRLPNHSLLVRRITFVGNSIFVPLFLIGVGLINDIHVFWQGPITLWIAAWLIGAKLMGKSLAAWMSQWTFRFSAMERQLVFGLTHSAAAGTLAIATIGYQMGVFNLEVMNASVLMILVLCTLSGFITEHAAKQLALQEDALLESEHVVDRWLLTSVKEDLSSQMKQLAEMASLKNIELAESPDWIDVGRTVEHTTKTILVYHESQPINTVNRLLVAVPRYAEKERDFITCFGFIRRLSGEMGAQVIFYANEATQVALKAMCRRKGKNLSAGFREMDDWEDVLTIAKDMGKNDLPILLSSRKATASYNPLFERIPQIIEQFFMESGFMVIYPEQQTGGEDEDVFLTEMPQTSRTWSIVTSIKKVILRFVRYQQEDTI